MDTDRQNLRVLVHAPIGRDGPASADLLRQARLDVTVCASLSDLCREIEAGVGAVFLAEEGLFGKDIAQLRRWIDSQPAWSDLPVVILTSHQEQLAVRTWRRTIVEALGNVSLLERPVQPITLTSALHSALRARHRQYEVEGLIRSREKAAERLEELVTERTQELENANGELRLQMAERARVEESLLQAQKIEAVGQLTGGIAHDFNNLLMVITGGLEMLDRQKDPARRKRLKEGMLQAAMRGSGLTRQLLAFSRRQALQPKSVDIVTQIGGMRELLDRSLRGDVLVDFDFAEELWPVEVDPGELELAVLNLAVNARDAMPHGGTIMVRARNLPNVSDESLSGDYVCLSVIDTGTGMSPQVQARVFEPFFTTKDIGKGSGLGLPQVHGFATQSGGDVRIASEAGRGTSIALYLRRSHRPLPDGDRHLADLHIDARLPQKVGSVLLVEDNDEVATLVTEMLHQLGYDVTRTASAKAALGALANKRAVDLVFSDIMMPGGMNGIDLAREVRKRCCDLPILLTSGYAEASAKDAKGTGVRILAKPYRIDELSQAIHAATMMFRSSDDEADLSEE